MSQLEGIAQRVLRPFVLGEPGMVEPADQGPVAAWAQKTALGAMLVSSEEDRVAGYGLPTSEYRNLYVLRDQLRPLPASWLWIGRYVGERIGATWVTPLVVAIDGIPEPVQPQAYLVTIVLGHLIIHGVRFTTPGFQLEPFTRQALPQLWPVKDRVDWPGGDTVDDNTFLCFSGGKDLLVQVAHVSLGPWKPATDLDPSRAVGSMIQLPTICGKHVVYYPGVLAREAMLGRFHAFMTSCECAQAYLIQTEADGAHCKWAGDARAITAKYEALPGQELTIEDEGGTFVCKRLVD
jgi:hypothetical protein